MICRTACGDREAFLCRKLDRVSLSRRKCFNLKPVGGKKRQTGAERNPTPPPPPPVNPQLLSSSVPGPVPTGTCQRPQRPGDTLRPAHIIQSNVLIQTFPGSRQNSGRNRSCQSELREEPLLSDRTQDNKQIGEKQLIKRGPVVMVS